MAICSIGGQSGGRLLLRTDAVRSKVGEIPQGTVFPMGRRKRMARTGSEVPDPGNADFHSDGENPSFRPGVDVEYAGPLGSTSGGVDVFLDSEVEADRRRQTRHSENDGALERKTYRENHGERINADNVGCSGDGGRRKKFCGARRRRFFSAGPLRRKSLLR